MPACWIRTKTSKLGTSCTAQALLFGAKANGSEVPVCINLLQQSPTDGVLGGVYLAYPGAVRVIEFKRASNRSYKEHDKLDLLRGALTASPSLGRVSRTIFVGTWHSHPMDGSRVGIDIKTLNNIATDARGLPAASLVWIPNGLLCAVDRW